ncbi:F0F1 ATP synthase subunit epsilon [Blattabacterium cuenoti]|uniref:F0F1 ATP synthase subunit epsilon n=1 Tax=Blattabacterium cuenoti TaxID=1653831 RepID=UPI00163BAD64|nr:F0F1 ATP synthase subunit epsilon [Blattabacterium cuenoti]
MEVTIINLEKFLIKKEFVISIIAPGLNGYFQILENHITLISLLGKGILTLKKVDNIKFTISIKCGIMQVEKNIVFIIL